MSCKRWSTSNTLSKMLIAACLLTLAIDSPPRPAQADAVEETVDVRVYVGIHFRNSDVVAQEQGKRIAHWTFKHFLRPVKK